MEDGDGCSSICKVEFGFECHGDGDGPDLCFDSAQPRAVLSLLGRNVLVVKFNEPVRVLVGSGALASTMQVSVNVKCELSWELVSEFEKDAVITQLKIAVTPECTLNRRKITYLVHFEDPSLLLDLGNNPLSEQTLQIKTGEISYVSPSLQESVATVGTLFEVSSTATLGLMLGNVLFQSVAVESFWNFLNMVQVLSYLPIIDVFIPSNLEIFIMEYLSMKKLAVPMELLYRLPLDPSALADFFHTDALGEKFALNDYEAFNFLYAFFDELFTWTLMGLLYVGLRVLCRLLPNGKCERIRKWKEEYEYNCVIRTLIEAYLNLNFCALMNIKKVTRLNSVAREHSIGPCLFFRRLSRSRSFALHQ